MNSHEMSEHPVSRERPQALHSSRPGMQRSPGIPTWSHILSLMTGRAWNSTFQAQQPNREFYSALLYHRLALCFWTATYDRIHEGWETDEMSVKQAECLG